MNNLKRFVLILALIVVGLIDISIFWNSHLYYQTKEIGNDEKKIQSLENAVNLFPFNDLVFYELGRTHFDLAIDDITNSEQRDSHLQKSIENYIRSIRLNPGYYLSHFHLAQSLLHQSYLSSVDIDFYKEYKKAALLTSFDREAYFEVGKILLSNWTELSEEDRRFTTNILRNAVNEKEKLQSILQSWAVNVADYDVIGGMLPDNPGSYRHYAQFLGVRGFSLEERQNRLAQAEFMEFENAKRIYGSGEREYRASRLKNALSQFQSCLNMLKRIRFYQNLTDQRLIDFSEFKNFQKFVYLSLAKTLIQTSRNLNKADVYLRSYLELEDNAAKLDELESYLKSRSLLADKADLDSKDLTPFFFKVLIDYKLSRYREIIKEGAGLEESHITPPEIFKKDWVKVFQIIGDSNQNVDFMYDAEKFYQKAMQLEPSNLEVLFSIRKNYLKLNEAEKVLEVEREIENLISPKEIVIANSFIQKGQIFNLPFILDGNKVYISIHFQDKQIKNFPLVAIFFNGKVIWENYLKSEILSFAASSDIGTNTLQILPINQPIQILKANYSKEGFTHPEGFSGAIYEIPPRDEVTRDEFDETERQGVRAERREEDIKEIDPVSPRKVSQVAEDPAMTSLSKSTGEKDISTYEASDFSYLKRIVLHREEGSLVIEIQSDPFLSFDSFELSGPSRIVIDIAGLDDIQNRRYIEVYDYGIQAIKTGMFKYDTARVVVHLKGKIPKYRVKKTESGLKIIFR